MGWLLAKDDEENASWTISVYDNHIEIYRKEMQIRVQRVRLLRMVQHVVVWAASAAIACCCNFA